MKKNNTLQIKMNINGELVVVPLVFSDLRSIEIYISYCDDFKHFINTIRYTNSREENNGTNFDNKSIKVSNFINSNALPETLQLDNDLPVFYKNDRDIVLSKPEDIEKLIIMFGIQDEKIHLLVNYLKEITAVLIKGKDKDVLRILMDSAYSNYHTWLLFAKYAKLVLRKPLINANSKEKIETLYRNRIDELNYHEGHISIYDQILNNIWPYVIKQEELKQKEDEEKKEETIALPRGETEEEKYKKMLKRKEFEESLLQEDEDEYEDDFLGPTKANDPRYHSID